MSLAKSERSFSVAPGRPVLDAALQAGMKVPHRCRGGNCGACRARLLSGRVAYPNGRPLGLSDAEVEEGFVLLCQARALEDVTLDIIEPGPRDAAEVRRLPARIERTQRLAHDVLGVFLRLPAVAPLPFEPGQYLDVMLRGGRRRSFSIASPPHDARLLELHVRRVSGGEWTEPLFAAPAEGTLLEVEGPLGRFVYRGDTRAPMLLIGGGTGLAPLKSIYRHVIETSVERRISLYWGVRDERDLYAHRELEELAARTANFSYCAVLSDAGVAWQGRRGRVHETVCEDLGTLAGRDIYASGPPAMIAAIREKFPAWGADPARLFFDSFDYAADSPVRQCTIAASRS